MKLKSKILVIAGSDSSGGAGIQADIKTITSLGCYASTAITSITAQNTLSVKSILNINPRMVVDQIQFTVKDIRPDAVKIGMLYSSPVIKAVSRLLKKLKLKKIILDPVMVSTSGIRLINKNAIQNLIVNLFSHASLITPNIPEAEILSKIQIRSVEDMIKACKIISKLGCKNVLLKGGHLKNEKLIDVLLLDKKNIKIFESKKINTYNTHGTGCTLSSAIASYYSCGKDLKKSCYLAIKYVNNAIRTAPNFGKGNGPINHLNNIKVNN